MFVLSGPVRFPARFENGCKGKKGSLKDEIDGLRKEIVKINEAIPSFRGNQAEGRAEITEIRAQIRRFV